MNPPHPPRSSRAALRPWAIGLVSLTSLLVLHTLASRPPTPLPADAPPAEFSEARALNVVRHLAEELGPRIPGTPAHEQSLQYLLGALRAIPGLEVQLHEATETYLDGEMISCRIRSVLARLPGRGTEAVMLAAHVDSAPEAAGAGDDGSGVAAMVEVARALASGPKLESTVLFAFDGEEENGLCGAASLMKHPWLRDARAFLNLDSTGLSGRATLFEVGPGNPWVFDAYARAAPHPYGNALGQDLYHSGLMQGDTDGRVFRDARIPGLDLALFEDGYAVHSPLDRFDRLAPGGLQHMGDNALAVTRELAGRALPPRDDAAGPIAYYDVLGLWMFGYGPSTAWTLAVLALLLVAGASWLAMRRGQVSPGRAAGGFGIALLSLVLALLLPAAFSFAPHFLFGRPHGWYAAPWLASVCFGVLAFAGALLPRWLFGRKLDTRAAWLGGLWLWVLLLGVMQAAGLGTAYLPLWWAVGGALALAASTRLPEHARALALYAGWLPGMLLTLQAGSAMVAVFVPIAGRLPIGLPMDPLMAVLAALPVAAGAVLGLAPMQEEKRLGLPTAAAAMLGASLLAVLVLHFPYTPERPKRLWMEHHQKEDAGELIISSWDFPDPSAAFAAFPPSMSRVPNTGSRTRYSMPVPRAELPPPPRLEVIDSSFDAASGLRTLKLRLDAGASYRVLMNIPRAALEGWSLTGTLPKLDDGDDEYVIAVIAPPPEGWEVTLRLRGPEPVPFEVKGNLLTRTGEIESALSRLPPWTCSNVRVTTSAAFRL